MSEYRAIRIDRDGLIITSILMVCRSDADAIHQAELRTEGDETEIWCGDRLAERLPRTSK